MNNKLQVQVPMVSEGPSPVQPVNLFSKSKFVYTEFKYPSITCTLWSQVHVVSLVWDMHSGTHVHAQCIYMTSLPSKTHMQYTYMYMYASLPYPIMMPLCTLGTFNRNIMSLN